MQINIPELAVVAMIGISGSGKTTFANRVFKHTEVLSSDAYRAIVSDDENDQRATKDAFETLYFTADKRLNNRRLTVIDATNVLSDDRKKVIELARRQNCNAVAIILDTPFEECVKRNEDRPERKINLNAMRRQQQALKRSIKYLKKEGFRYIYKLTPKDAAEAEIIRNKLWNDKKDLHGPFDIIGDIHGCYNELCELLKNLGYTVDRENFKATPPEGRTAIFLGDFTDRGCSNLAVLRLVSSMCAAGSALAVPGNHDIKLLKYLRGSNVQITHGFANTKEEIDDLNNEQKQEIQKFIDGLISHYVLDDGKLVVAHAGLPEKLQGRASGKVREFCLYGDITGEKDDDGLPVRLDWTKDYRGKALMVYGHTPTAEAEFVNNTICLDTGCAFGGKLTALRYPENEIVSVQAHKEYEKAPKPFLTTADTNEQLPNLKDILETNQIHTPLMGAIKIYEDNRAAALEIMSRYSADPHWLIYLPPTMSPCDASDLPDYLEYPKQAIGFYADNGVDRVICEKKHMGSRCVIIVCRDPETARKRFSVDDGSIGILYSRTGRRFFDNTETENALLKRLRDLLDQRGFFDEFKTDWVCLDTEVMPWSAKAIGLIKSQYAPVGRSGRTATASAVSAIENAVYTLENTNHELAPGSIDIKALLNRYVKKQKAALLYTDAYREYCFRAEKPEDYRIAPFHILAAEGQTFMNRNHIWHMENIKKYIVEEVGVFIATPYITVDTYDERSISQAEEWWLDLTEDGGEGMVVKPMEFTAHNGSFLMQPAIKCRGREYLRIIYGPEYLFPDNLARLKKRSLQKKRRLALNEYALGELSLRRFVEGAPFSKVHECVFGVLAMESEPVDPRL